jgi:sugar lactone lactonase YvrE
MTTPVTSPDVEVRTIASGLQFPEGPIWVDPLVTNLCFGGDDMSTAFVTCSATGHLVAIEWPRPGLALAFSGAAAR